MSGMAELLGTYGYAALVVGTFLEGETVLVAAAFLAHRGYMDLGLIILCAFAGSTTGDQTFFWLGRRHGQPWLAKHPRWRERLARVDRLMERHSRLVLLGFRFLYGLRAVTPFALGMSSLPFGIFALYNVIGALAWAASVAGAGYVFGSTMELFLERAAHYELAIFGGILVIGGIIWVLRTRKKHRCSDHA